MTKINKIVMNGFKSFAKHTELLFGSGFNCVLGPNGSGKSNVLDAICFVLGKTSSKSMRAEKSANLIYNGGKSKKPGKQGEVSIYFDNSDKTFPTDDNTVKITRIIRDNGQSIYKINDKLRTRQQIVDLLSVARINPDGYNIIMQGDIMQFCEMPTEERRKLIEQISGISIYEEKKHKAMLELEKVSGKLTEMEIILTERSTQLKELKKDRDQALKYREMNDKIKQNKASYLKIQIDKKEGERKKTKEQLDKANEELDKLHKKIIELKQDNEEKKDEIEKITKEIEEKGEKEQVSLNREIETLKIELTKRNFRIDVCKNEISRITKRETELNTSLKELDDKVKALNKDKEEFNKKRSSKEKEKYEFTNKIAAFKQKHKLENAADMEKNIEEMDKKADELQKEIQIQNEKQHNLIREKDRLLHEINTIDARISRIVDVEKQYKQQVDDLKNKRQSFKNTTLELNKALNDDSTLAAQLGNARKKLMEANEELAKLTVRNAGIKEATTGDIAIKKILEIKDKKGGIYGTIAELGNVSSKYALAMEVAAGARLKSIVVDDDRIAAECIKYLKEKRFGIASFLPLDKIKPKHSTDIEKYSKAKGCHGLAIDLVSFDKKFKKIFEYVFADTLIVDDIDVARRIGIGNAKMVTLDGDITEISGVMRGGFRERKKQSLGFKEQEVESGINECQQKVAELGNTASILEKRRMENEELISRLRAHRASLEGEIIKAEKSINIDSGDLNVSKQKKTEFQEEEKKVNEEINKIQNKIVEFSRGLAKIKTEKQMLRSKVTELRNPALLAELTTFEEKTKELNENIIQLTSDAKSIDLQITMHNSEKDKTEQIIRQIKKDGAQFKDEISKLEKIIGEENKTLKEKEEKSTEFYARFRALFAKRSKINDEIQKVEIIITNKQDESRKIEIRGNTFSLKQAEMAAELAGMQAEFQQYEGVRLDTSRAEDSLKNDINKFEKMKEEIGFVNMRALEIYEEVEKQYISLSEKKGTLEKEKGDVLLLMKEVEAKKIELFLKTFNVANENFKRFFSMISSKGEAYLELESPESPFEAGLTIKVRITGQKFLDIRSLSGGEKTMTALAFIFAIQEHDPASFYVLDEVDAALDKHNSEKFAKLIRRYADKAQYIIISHNDNVISEADTLYGISMNENGISQIVSLKI